LARRSGSRGSADRFAAWILARCGPSPGLASLAVVELDGRVVGSILHDAFVEAAQEDAAADMQQMVGASTEERALSSPWFGVRSRLPWLNINLITAFFASAVVGLFESTRARFTAVAILMPVVAGQSGNTGAQALAVSMRASSCGRSGSSRRPSWKVDLFHLTAKWSREDALD
jgi:Mg/Co/Ni transporter MgtE